MTVTSRHAVPITRDHVTDRQTDTLPGWLASREILCVRARDEKASLWECEQQQCKQLTLTLRLCVSGVSRLPGPSEHKVSVCFVYFLSVFRSGNARFVIFQSLVCVVVGGGGPPEMELCKKNFRILMGII